MTKYFKFNHEDYAHVSGDVVEVSGVYEVRRLVKYKFPYAINVRISRSEVEVDRLPDEWQHRCHYVLADFDDWKGQCVGMCNFYER